MVAGGRPWAPEPTASIRPVNHRNEFSNAPQWSKSSAWRIRSASVAATDPQPPSATFSFQASRWWKVGASRYGSEVPNSRWSNPSSVARSATQSRSPVVEDLALARLEASAGPDVHHDQPGGSQVADERPALALALLVVLLHELPQDRPGVPVGRLDPLPERPLGELTGREVADELVDPVGIMPLTTRSFHHGFLAMSSHHDCEMFQSSCMSWSSITIALETVENSQRITGSVHDSR